MQLLPQDAARWLSTLPTFQPPIDASAVKTDASLRSYHRVQDLQHRAFILCQLEAHENFDRVLAIQKAYEASSVAVPKALHWKAPYILFEDLGKIHLKTFLANHSLSPNIQKQILDQILAIQSISIKSIPGYKTYQKVVKEKEFLDFFNLIHDYPWQTQTNCCVETLLNHILSLPLTTVHKDFHWENLLVQNHQLRVLDYSDSLQGPVSYDLASFIADRGFYQRFSKQSVALIQSFCQQVDSLLAPEHVWGTVALRLFKIIGNFDRLSRDIHLRYRAYQQEAVETLIQIPWKTCIPQTWQPDQLLYLGQCLSRL